MRKTGKKIIGQNFLERHIDLAREVKLSTDHVIVDRSDWEDIVEFFHKNPVLVSQVGKQEPIVGVHYQKGADLIVEIGGGNCWLADGEGDPPRTLIKDNAKTFFSHVEARKAIERALETHPLTFRSYKIVKKNL